MVKGGPRCGPGILDRGEKDVHSRCSIRKGDFVGLEGGRDSSVAGGTRGSLNRQSELSKAPACARFESGD